MTVSSMGGLKGSGLAVLFWISVSGSLCAQQPVTPAQPAQPAATQPANPTQPPADTGLPASFQVPPAPPEMMTLEKNLINEEMEKGFPRLRIEYSKALRNGVLDQKSQDIIRQGLEYRVLSLSKPEPVEPEAKAKHKSAQVLRAELMRDIREAGKLQTNARLTEQFREAVLKEIVTQAQKLFDNNFEVRLNAVLLLGELNLQEPVKSATVNQPEIPYVGAAQPLLDVLLDPGQPDAVKVAAARGLGRISKVESLKPDMKLKIAEGFVSELARPDEHYWYEMRLLNSLGMVDVIYDRGVNRRPFVIETLMRYMTDKQKNWLVRSEAARSLGGVPLDNDINASLIAHQLAAFAHEMGEAQIKSPAQFHWRYSFLKVYLAFQPADDAERNRFVGLLNKAAKSKIPSTHQKAVRDAYQQILPLVVEILKVEEGKPLNQNAVTNLGAWVKQNPPESDKLAENLPSLNLPNLTRNAAVKP